MGSTISTNKIQKIFFLSRKERIVYDFDVSIYDVNDKLKSIYDNYDIIFIPDFVNHSHEYFLEEDIDISSDNIEKYIYMIQDIRDKVYKEFDEKLPDIYNNRLYGYKLKNIPSKKKDHIIDIIYSNFDDLESENFKKNLDKKIKTYYKNTISDKTKYIFFQLINNEKDDSLIINNYEIKHRYDEDWKEKINDMSKTVSPNDEYVQNKIKNQYSQYHLVHATNYIKDTIINGNLCNAGDCSTKFYDEKTGEYLFPKKKKTNYDNGIPGIYMEIFDESFRPPMKNKDPFVFSKIDTFYGQTGFIFPFENIFGKYYIDLKSYQGYGASNNITLDRFINYRQFGEAVIRANQIPISLASSIFVMFNVFERIYISDKLFGDKRRTKLPTLGDVIRLYRKNPDNKWYIRKSSFLKIINLYDRFNIKLPPIYCILSVDSIRMIEKLYDSPLDVNSDDD